MTPRWPRYAAALLGFVWFVQLGGLHTLNPLNLGWLLDGDWRQHLLGWLFYRNEPWTFPLGTLKTLPYPVGSAIGFTDSNPLVSILLKPFSGWLPAEVQFIGPWLAFCFAMQGYFGAALASTVTKEPAQQMLGGYLFVLSPVLAARLGHDTLCAQWLLLGLMYVGFREYADAADVRRGTRLAMLLAGLAAAIHPYLAAMSATLAIACFLRLWRGRLIGFPRAIALIATTLAIMFAVMFTIGYFIDAKSGSVGFETYSADLVTLIDGAGFSKLIPRFPLAAGRWEGFGFVGVGVLIGFVFAVIAWIGTRARPQRGAWILVAACVVMAVYSLSTKVTFVEHQVARLHTLLDRFEFITKPFRASGRFIWPLHYLVMLAGLWGVTRLFGGKRPASVGTAVLAVIVIVQATDYKNQPTMLAEKHFREAPVKDFELAKGHYQHMAVYPTQILGACGSAYEEDYVYRYMLEAYRLNLTFNSGIFARVPLDRMQQACGDLYRSVDAGKLDPQTIYIASPWTLAHLKEIGAVCGRFDGDWVCVSRDSDEAFRTYLETGQVIPRKLP